MKSSPSEESSPPSSPIRPMTPSPPKKAKAQPSNGKSSGGGGGVWTAEKSAIFAERVIAAGTEHVNREQLAHEIWRVAIVEGCSVRTLK